jgi:hypothetical protein
MDNHQAARCDVTFLIRIMPKSEAVKWIGRARIEASRLNCLTSVPVLTLDVREDRVMNEKARRKALTSEYKQTHTEAGVYRIINTRNDKSLIGSSPNLTSVRNKLEFARSTNSPVVLDHRLGSDIRQYGIDAFTFEVLEVLETRPEMSRAEILDDLSTLEELWREKLDPALLY